MPGNGEQLTVQTPAITDPASTQNPVVNGEQTNATPALEQPTERKWKAQLPDKWKKDARLDKYSSLDEAIADFLDGSSTGTKESGEGSQEKPPVTAYTFTKAFSEDADIDGSLSRKLTDTLKSLGLGQEQAEPIYNALVDYQNGNIETFKTKGKSMCEQTLKETWGDKYDAKLASMQRAYGKLVGEGSEMDKGLKLTGSQNNPFIAQLLAEIGESMNEHTPPNRSSVGTHPKSGGFLLRENEVYPWAR